MRAGAANNRQLSVLFADLRPLGFAPGVLRAHVPAGMKPAAESLLPEITALLRATVGDEAARVELVAPEVTLARAEPASASIAEHPLVKEAIELLGARVVGVYPRTKPPA